MIGALVRVAASAAVVFDDQVHLFDAFVPEDLIVLPEFGHRCVGLVEAGLFVDGGVETAVAALLSFVRDVADAPRGRLAAGGLFEGFEPEMGGAVAVVQRGGPILGALRIEFV